MKTKFKELASTINENRVPIIRRTLIIGASVIAVTLTVGVFAKIPATETIVEVIE